MRQVTLLKQRRLSLSRPSIGLPRRRRKRRGVRPGRSPARLETALLTELQSDKSCIVEGVNRIGGIE